MELRKELEPIERTEEYKYQIKTMIQKIELLLDNKQTADKEIENFNNFTGRKYTPYDFISYGAAMSLDEFVEEACNPVPSRIAGITNEELIELVRRVKDFETYGVDTGFYLQLLQANVIIPGISDLIFWSGDLSPEEIIEKALSYKAIQL